MLLTHLATRAVRVEHGEKRGCSFLIGGKSNRSGFIGLVQQLVSKCLHLFARRLISSNRGFHLRDRAVSHQLELGLRSFLVGLSARDASFVSIANLQGRRNSEHHSV